MYKQLQDDINGVENLFGKVKQQGIRFLQDIQHRPTTVKYTAGPSSKISEEGIGALGALTRFNEQFEQAIVGSTGPRYWGFVTGGSTPAAIMGDWLAAVYDQNTQTIKGQGDISAVIEKDAIALLLELFDLPADFTGGFVTGATMSNFTCLGVARQWLGKKYGKDIAREGVSGRLPVLTTTPHSSSLKSLSMLGMGSSNFITVKTIEGNREAMDMTDLEVKINELKGQPFILISSAATVNTADFDDFKTISKLKEKYDCWWHIDAAFGGFAALSKEHKHLLDGWAGADSITVDSHKWLNVPYENAVFFVKEKHSHLQIETFQNSNAPYLGNPLENFNYLNFLPENSRRLKALPVWFTLMAYGRDGYRMIVENSIDMARQFGKYMENNERFELLAPVRLNTVCFTLKGKEDLAGLFLSKLNDTQKVFMTPTIYKGRKGIRAAFVNWRTTESDIKIAIDEMEKIYRSF
ncbi:MAG: aspartate aminotransferase family protein [Chitinophagaceae bacterium]|nr:MAG: aspartate aminotransferase family protein [Chitinophagaceae bacterium]